MSTPCSSIPFAIEQICLPAFLWSSFVTVHFLVKVQRFSLNVYPTSLFTRPLVIIILCHASCPFRSIFFAPHPTPEKKLFQLQFISFRFWFSFVVRFTRDKKKKIEKNKQNKKEKNITNRYLRFATGTQLLHTRIEGNKNVEKALRTHSFRSRK